MSPDTAEIAIDDAPRARARARPGNLSAGPLGAIWTALGATWTADSARSTAVRETWRALWVSRLLVWIAGAGTVAALGFGPRRGAFDPPGITTGFGWLGDVLAAPAARWDSAWYLVIAHYGYRPELSAYGTASRDAFFPLYPLALRMLSDLGVQAVLAGVLFSLGAFALALYGIHRLCTLELGGDRGRAGEIARLAVLVMALSPMAFFFSAVYSESLFLALSVGVFWCARQGRWAWVGVLGALATATRSTGIVLMAPALMLYVYGPREDRTQDWVSAGPAFINRIRPRYRLRANALWLALMPAGLLLYMAYLGLHGGDPLAPLRSQNVWGRQFAGPYVGVWDGVRAAFEGARQLLSGQSAHLYYPIVSGSPMIAAGHNLMLLAFLAAAVPLVVIVWRALPPAYGVYVIVALALPLSYPVASEPLMSLPRFEIVLFPLGIALAVWLAAHARLRVPVLVVSGCLMMFCAAQFSTWHWVA